MVDLPPLDERRTGPSDVVTEGVMPELLLCTALVRSGLVDGAGASLLLGPGDRIGLAATDETFAEVAETQFSNWEGPGPEVVRGGRSVVVEDLHEQGARWPLTTPHAATTSMRSLATLPLLVGGVVVGLFGVYRTRPGAFTRTEMAQLHSAAATVGALVGARFNEVDLALRAPAPTLAIAIATGMVMARLGVEGDDALALLRAKAFALSVGAPALARELASGTARIDDLFDLPVEP